LLKIMKPKLVEFKAHIQSQIKNYEELPQLNTSLQASRAQVFRSMDAIVCMHAIQSVGTLIEVNKKNQVRLEMDMHFDQLICIATSVDWQMSIGVMQQYVARPDTPNTMMHMLFDELDRCSKSVHLSAMEARVCFQKDVTIEYRDTTTDYQAWHQFATIHHREDVEELVFPQLSES